ncbi:MAG: glycogen/starch synthase [Muribaculaceae bacterium]|nr:glycogen/starch synthase [Muribaculaceae bacterium]
MEVKKVLFISQEIAPYVPERRLSQVGRIFPQGIKEQGIEERTFMPKYGMIAERSNQLHEMIRLSGMNVIIDDTDHPLIIKVATLQQAHFQVYFIYNEDYFASNRIDELEMNCSPHDNDERSMFFVRAVIESIRKMRWVPDIIQCTGWISALAPVYIRTLYGDDPSFRDAKIVTALFNEQIAGPLDERLSEKMHMDGIPKNALKPIAGKELTYDELMAYSLKYSDAVIQCEDGVSDGILEAASGLPQLQFIDDDDVNKVKEFYASLRD